MVPWNRSQTALWLGDRAGMRWCRNPLGGQGVDEGAGYIFAPVVRQDCPDPHPVTAIEAQGLGDEAGRHATAGCAEHDGGDRGTG
jgi:hypothetical protein